MAEEMEKGKEEIQVKKEGKKNGRKNERRSRRRDARERNRSGKYGWHTKGLKEM